MEPGRPDVATGPRRRILEDFNWVRTSCRRSLKSSELGHILPYFAERLQAAFSYHPVASPPTDKDVASITAPIRGIIGSGELVISRALLDALPLVEIISVCGVGYDRVDVPAARERGIIVTHTPGVLDDDVADLGFGLILSPPGRFPRPTVLSGPGCGAKGPLRFGRKVSGARLGIVGLGRIGRAIATRAQAFGMTIAYCSRRSSR